SPDDLGAEARNVIFAGQAGRHLHVAARKAEIEWPDGIFSAPAQQILKARKDHAALHRILDGVFSRPHQFHARVALVIWRQHQYRSSDRTAVLYQSSTPVRQT